MALDCFWNAFSPTLGFAAIRTLISLICDPKWMETDKILRLEKSTHGLKPPSKAFMKQVGEEMLKFVKRVEYKSPVNPQRACAERKVRNFIRISVQIPR